jgi:hypothetical protein
MIVHEEYQVAMSCDPLQHHIEMLIDRGTTTRTFSQRGRKLPSGPPTVR